MVTMTVFINDRQWRSFAWPSGERCFLMAIFPQRADHRIELRRAGDDAGDPGVAVIGDRCSSANRCSPQ